MEGILALRLLAAHAAGGRRTVRPLTAGAAHAAHADAYRTGLGGALRLGLAGGERIALSIRKISGREEHKGRVVSRLACIKRRAVAVGNGEGAALRQQRCSAAGKASPLRLIFAAGQLFSAGAFLPAGLLLLRSFIRQFRGAAETTQG